MLFFKARYSITLPKQMTFSCTCQMHVHQNLDSTNYNAKNFWVIAFPYLCLPVLFKQFHIYAQAQPHAIYPDLISKNYCQLLICWCSIMHPIIEPWGASCESSDVVLKL